jgi:hypothetical protein
MLTAGQRRLRWLTEQYESGRMVVAIGFDSLYLGQQPLFKGKQFASTDQVSVIWFGSTGAEYSPALARFSDANLLTVTPLVGVDQAMTMLQEYLHRKEDRGKGSTPSLAVPTALLIGFLVLVVDHAAEQSSSGTDGRAHAGVAGHGADRGPTRRAADGAGSGTPLRVGHRRTTGEREHSDDDERRDLHDAISLVISVGTGIR